MSEQVKHLPDSTVHSENLPTNEEYLSGLAKRHFRGNVWGRFFYFANILAILALIALFVNITNQAVGLVGLEYEVLPDAIAERPLEELTALELEQIIEANVPGRLRVIIRDNLSPITSAEFTQLPLTQTLPGVNLPEGVNPAEQTINDLEQEQLAYIVANNIDQGRLIDIVITEVAKPRVVGSWSLFDSLFNRSRIEAELAESNPEAVLEFQSWVDFDFLTSPGSSSAAVAGLRTALLGTIWIMIITVIVAFPLGVGAAIYLEEYSTGNGWLERLIETNIRNLAGVPSIIYGMLGLAVFVRALVGLTSGSIFGITDANGRTVLSAGLTMALLILPVIIINAQEALRAVPPSYREGSFGLGATKWQTIWNAVLPAAFPGILTGLILSMSRAIGETAPLIVVGASTFISLDPNGPFSKFTVVPIQIYQWTSRPEAEFRNLAAAAIIVLLVLLLVLNGTAIFLRQYFRRKLQA